EICFKVFSNRLDRNHFDRTTLSVARVVDEPIDSSEGAHRLIDELLAIRLGGDISGNRQSVAALRFDVTHQGFESVGSPGGDDNSGAFACQPAGSRFTNSGGGAGHNHDLTIELSHRTAPQWQGILPSKF